VAAGKIFLSKEATRPCFSLFQLNIRVIKPKQKGNRNPENSEYDPDHF